MTDDVFEDLVNLYLDKEINPAQLRILREELDRNPGRREVFESYCRMHQATHFAALTAQPVIPRLSHDLEGGGKPGFFAFNRQVWAAALIILVIGSFATVYFNGPFGSAHIAQARPTNNLQRIEGFTQSNPQSSPPLLEYFQTIKVQNQTESWDFVHEIRHMRANPAFQDTQQPSYYSLNEPTVTAQPPIELGQGFELEYSSYEFKR